LQGNKEGEEEGYGSIEIAFLEPDIGCEVCGFGISNLIRLMSVKSLNPSGSGPDEHLLCRAR
jgi:hypothetical protein